MKKISLVYKEEYCAEFKVEVAQAATATHTSAAT